MSGPTFSASVVRKPKDIIVAAPQFPRELRNKLNTSELLTLIAEATAGASSKLNTINSIKEVMEKGKDNVLINNVEVETFVKHLEVHCTRFDMGHFMHNFPLLEEALVDDSDRFRSKKTVDLFAKWDMLTNKDNDRKEILQKIRDSISWLKTYVTEASVSYLQDMEWLHRHLMNSMHPRLRDDVLSTLRHDFPTNQHGGPLTFAIMIDKVINLLQTAIDSLKETILKYNIKDVPGEDILLIVRRFLYAIKRLESNQALDSRFISKLYNVFQTSSVREFNEQVAFLQNSTCGSRGVTLTYKEILDEVTEYYTMLWHDDKWVGVTPEEQESAFVGSQTGINNDDSKSSSDPPPGPSPYCAPCSDDQICASPLRYQRTIKGKVMKYCARCTRFKGSQKKGRWNTSHFTDEHTGGRPRTNTALPPPAQEGSISFADALMSQHGPASAPSE